MKPLICDRIETSKYPGQDTDKILKELGYSDDVINDLKAQKVV